MKLERLILYFTVSFKYEENKYKEIVQIGLKYLLALYIEMLWIRSV